MPLLKAVHFIFHTVYFIRIYWDCFMIDYSIVFCCLTRAIPYAKLILIQKIHLWLPCKALSYQSVKCPVCASCQYLHFSRWDANKKLEYLRHKILKILAKFTKRKKTLSFSIWGEKGVSSKRGYFSVQTW